MPSELIRQVRVLDPNGNSDQIVDVLIVDGIIHRIAPQITDMPEGLTDLQICDRTGLVLGPGLVDLYSHSGEPGFESRETLQSLLKAAEAGGFTRVALLPDTHPAIDNPSVVEWMQSQRRTMTDAIPQLYIWGAVTEQVQGTQMTELAELVGAGVVGFSDGKPIQNKLLIRRLLEYAHPLNKPIALWCCDQDLTGDGVVREGVESLRLGLPGSPAIAETSALASVLEIVALTRTPVHFMRISTARGVELIRHAKERGLPVTASTTWMHLALNVKSIHTYDPNLHLAPPLGNPADQTALIEGIQAGVIDAIAIDHTPYTYEEKTVAFAAAPPGAIGLELALAVLWEMLVSSGKLSALQLWQSLSTSPAHCLGQSAAKIQAGQTAELTLFDPDHPWQVNPQTLKSLATNTPWLGEYLSGRVVKSWGLSH